MWQQDKSELEKIGDRPQVKAFGAIGSLKKF
jgi:hypothetical protein